MRNIDSKNLNKERFDLIIRFVYFRNKSKLSAKALSEMLDKSVGYIGKFEQGKLNMPTDVLFECIRIFGVSKEEFFSEKYKNFEEEKKLLNRFRNLSKENQELTFKIMDSMK